MGDVAVEQDEYMYYSYASQLCCVAINTYMYTALLLAVVIVAFVINIGSVGYEIDLVKS